MPANYSEQIFKERVWEKLKRKLLERGLMTQEEIAEMEAGRLRVTSGEIKLWEELLDGNEDTNQADTTPAP